MRVRLPIFILAIILLVLLSYDVASYGISYEYLPNKTLSLYPGQNYMFKLTIQNKDPEPVNVNVALDSAIATLEGGPELKIPGETFDKYVYFNIKVPETAQPGDVYNINYLVSPVDKGEGQVPIAVRYDRNFKVLIVEKPADVEEQQPAPIPGEAGPGIAKWIFIPIIIIIVAVLAVLLWKKSNQISGRLVKKEQNLKPLEMKHHNAIKHETEAKFQPITQSYARPEQPVIKTINAKQEKKIAPHHYFHLRNGKSIKSLDELYSELRVMSREEFAHHVNTAKNDFANWAAHILEKPALASKLFKTTSKQETLDLIKNELNQS